MNINDLTIGQAKELASMFGGNTGTQDGLSSIIGEKCIIRTYSAGVWFGEIVEKSGKEIIVKDARRLWRWHTKKSISLSAIAMGDIDEGKSRIAEAVPSVWLEIIEVIPASDDAVKIIEGAKVDEAS